MGIKGKQINKKKINKNKNFKYQKTEIEILKVDTEIKEKYLEKMIKIFPVTMKSK